MVAAAQEGLVDRARRTADEVQRRASDCTRTVGGRVAGRELGVRVAEGEPGAAADVSGAVCYNSSIGVAACRRETRRPIQARALARISPIRRTSARAGPAPRIGDFYVAKLPRNLQDALDAALALHETLHEIYEFRLPSAVDSHGNEWKAGGSRDLAKRRLPPESWRAAVDRLAQNYTASWRKTILGVVPRLERRFPAIELLGIVSATHCGLLIALADKFCVFAGKLAKEKSLPSGSIRDLSIKKIKINEKSWRRMLATNTARHNHARNDWKKLAYGIRHEIELAAMPVSRGGTKPDAADSNQNGTRKRGRKASTWTAKRRAFAEARKTAGATWQAIYDAYAKKNPGDKDASAATIRLACTRKLRRKPTNRTK